MMESGQLYEEQEKKGYTNYDYNYKKPKKIKNSDKIGLMYLAMVFLSIFGGTILFFVLKIFNPNLTAEDCDGMFNSASMLVFSQVLFVSPAIVYLITEKKQGLKKLRIKKLHPINIILLPLLGLTLFPISSLINCISQLFVKSSIQEVANDMAQNVPMSIGVLCIALIPALFEEITYRGCIYNSFNKNGILKASLISGLMFGAMHMNLNQFSYAFVIGTVFSLIVEATDSLLSTMLLHFMLNGSSIIITYVSNKANVSKEVQEISKQDLLVSIKALIPMAVISAVFAFFLFKAIAKVSNRWEYIKENFKKEKTSKDGIFSIPLIIALVIAFGIMIVLR